jgi:acyl-CoA synthetase (AMP-forming)/AMP-acid ligase II
VSGASLQSRLLERIERRPEGRALAFPAAEGGFRWTDFAEVHARARRLARVLAEHGLRAGDVALVVLPSGELSAIATLAVLVAGGVPLLVAPPLVAGSLLDLPRTLTHAARTSRARLMLCADAMAAMRVDLAAGAPGTALVFGLSEPAGSAAEQTPVLPKAEAVAALQLTSGTTGLPRVCVWDHRAVLAALDAMTAAMALADDDVCLNWTPLYHDMGLVNNFLLCLTSGTPLALLGPEAFVKRPALWPRALSETGATVSWSPNFGFALAARRVTDAERVGVRLDRVRALWNAAERIHHATVVEFQSRYACYGLAPGAVRTNFGCAENVGGATFSDPRGSYPVERLDGDALFDEWVARPARADADPARVATFVGVGRPSPGLALEILDADGRPAADGCVGEIALRTPSRMRGYLGDDEATACAIRGDRLCTGDLGYLRNGELFWVGRVQERITVRGKKLDPSDFEPVLLTVAGLREGCFAVFGVEDEAQGTERIVVVAELRDPAAADAEAIAAEIRKQTFVRLGVTIGDVLLVAPRTLAKTSSGKRRHRHFRQLYLSGGLERWRAGAAG